MSPKILIVVVLVVIVSAFGMKQSRRSPAPGGPGSAVQAITSEAVLTHLNELREDKPALLFDEDLAHWAQAQLPLGTVNASTLTANTILERMQTEVEGIAAASAGVFRAPAMGQALYAELKSWKELTVSTYTHAAVVIREDPKVKRLAYVWVILAQRLPKFAPELLAEGVQQFYHECQRCQEPYNGHFPGGDRILLLQCPHCEQNYDILALNSQDHYRRANTYFSHLELPAAFPKQMGKRQEMETIWKSVLRHCRYENDAKSIISGKPQDSWQTSAETWHRGSGDCEDTSILLADWLISRGFKARVVIGETDAYQGHAWCVARIKDDVYLLETTLEGKNAPRTPPLAIEMSKKYRAEYLFDRDRLYFFKGGHKDGPGDCWDETLWVGVDSESPSIASAPATEAPWFSDTTSAGSVSVVASKAVPASTAD